MAFSVIRISIPIASAIFEGATFEEVSIGGKLAGYKATFKGHVYEDTALWRVCKALWLGQA